MVILYKDKDKSLIYDYSTRMFKVITFKGKYEVAAESIIDSVEEGSLKGARRSLSFEEEKEIFFLSLKSIPKGEERLREQLQKYDAKVAINGTVKKLDIPGLVSLARKRGVPRERESIFLSRVVYYLIERYYKNGDIPSLKSVKKVVENFCEIEKTIWKAKEIINDAQLQEIHGDGNKSSSKTSKNTL